MLTLENKQYGYGYYACASCGISWPIIKLKAGLCEKCTPKRSCGFCLAIDAIDESTGQCVDRAACSERYWRVDAKRELFEADAMRRLQLNQLIKHEPHHNIDCDYVNGWWACPEPCPASDPPWVEPG